MEDITGNIMKEIEALGSRLSRYESEYAGTSSRSNASTNCSGPAAGAAVPAAAVFADNNDQASELKEMRLAFNNLKKMVDRLQTRVEEQEQKLDDLEQYGRYNCLIVHKCENVPKQGEYLENEKYICNILNQNLKLNPSLQVNDIDVAHPLPSRNSNICPVIVKFIRRSQKNYVYSQKKMMKGKRMIITESLTKRRLQLLDAAREVFGWKSVWSFHGDIFTFAAGKKQVIHNVNDIVEIKKSMTL